MAPAAIAVGALALIAWAVAFSAKSGHAWDALRQVIKAAAMASAATGSCGGREVPRARIAAAACVATLAAAELVWWNAASSLNAEPPGYYSVLERPTGEEAAALAVLEREIKARHAQGERPRVEVVGVSGPWQNLAMTRGLEATNGYNPLRIGWYDRLVSPGETTHIVDQRLFPASFDGYDCALARELGLEYVVLGRPIEEVPHLARRPVSDVLLAGPKVWIYRLADAEPSVKLISRVMVANVGARSSRRRLRVNPASETALIDTARRFPGAICRPSKIAKATRRRSCPGARSRGGGGGQLAAGRPRPARGVLSRLVRRGRRPARPHAAHQRAVPGCRGERGPAHRGVPISRPSRSPTCAMPPSDSCTDSDSAAANSGCQLGGRSKGTPQTPHSRQAQQRLVRRRAPQRGHFSRSCSRVAAATSTSTSARSERRTHAMSLHRNVAAAHSSEQRHGHGMEAHHVRAPSARGAPARRASAARGCARAFSCDLSAAFACEPLDGRATGRRRAQCDPRRPSAARSRPPCDARWHAAAGRRRS